MSTVHVDVPEKHSVLISLVFLRVSDHFMICSSVMFELYVGSTEIWPVWELCEADAKRPYLELFDTDAFHLRYVGFSYYVVANSHVEFSLLFSFHNDSALPEQLPGGKWNCSGPHWPGLRPHLGCNMMRECEGGEDEAGCEYYDESEACGPGLISAAGRCYLYADDVIFANLSWAEASRECRKRDGYLVSPNTPEEWQVISDLLLKWIVFDTVFLGMQFRKSVLPRE